MAAEGIVDFAMLDSASEAATPDSAAAETVETPVETPAEVDSETPAEGGDETPVEDSTEGKETETHNADGTEKTPEEQEAFKKAAEEKAAARGGTKTTDATPANVRATLKAMRDADPKNAEVVKQLHGSFERWNAAKAIFPKGVAEMQEAKAFIDSVGGPDGYKQMQDAMDQVSASDELLYAADPKLWDNVIEDLKANEHPEALGALAPSFLSKLKAHDIDAYYNTTIPVVSEAMKEVHMDDFVAQFNDALSAKNEKGEAVPNIAKITKLIGDITRWYGNLTEDAKKRTSTPEETPERKKFLAEKAAFEKTKTDAAVADRKKFEYSVAEDCDKRNNTLLGKALGPFLKLPFFKDFPRDTIIDLGNGIKDRLYSALKADKTYQTQMDAMWRQKNPDRAKMVQYHEARVQAIANDIVTKTVQGRYPGYAKGGTAAGKAAAATEKKETATKAAAQSVASGKPIYVASRPTNLVRDAIKVGGKEYTASDLVTLQITGRGFVKTPDGKSVKFVTWRK